MRLQGELVFIDLALLLLILKKTQVSVELLCPIESIIKLTEPPVKHLHLGVRSLTSYHVAA